MDIKKATILLEKINTLHKSLTTDTDNITAIERDLMRSYLRQLYEVYLGNDVGSAATRTVRTEVIKPKTRTPTTRKPSPPPAPAPAPPPPPSRPTPRVIEVPEDLKQKVVPPPASVPPPPPKPKPAPAAPKPTPAAQGEEVAQLFEQSGGQDLSDRLSRTPIADLTKAMGLNERILTQNELFGGSKTDFDATMSALNGLKTFDEAKQYLAQNVITKYGWTSKQKQKKAKVLIKLISRRYG